jgi:hypothetical protein
VVEETASVCAGYPFENCPERSLLVLIKRSISVEVEQHGDAFIYA